MKLFSRKPGMYANHSANHKPVGLFVCADCGAVATEDSREVHIEWHEEVIERLKVLEERPVNIYPAQWQPYVQMQPALGTNAWQWPVSATITSTNDAETHWTINGPNQMAWTLEDEDERDQD